MLGVVLLPLLISQQLPSSNTDRSVIPTVLLAAFGFAVGWVRPVLRAWIVLAIGTVAAAIVILISWTDLLLNVAPVFLPVDAWRDQAILGIVGSVASVSVGFAGAAVMRRRGALPDATRPARSTIVAGAAVLAAVLVAAGLTAVVFSRTPLVVQDDQPRLTVVVTDDGLSISPAPIDRRITYRLIYESRASADTWLTQVRPLGIADGLPQAVTATEVAGWLAGDWQALGPRFENAIEWRPIAPGERRDGGDFAVGPSSDGSGGVLWYTSAPDALRDWPGDVFDGERPEAPWPIEDHLVVPVGP